jgi:hypothetical protein
MGKGKGESGGGSAFKGFERVNIEKYVPSLETSWKRYVMMDPTGGGSARCASVNPEPTENVFPDAIWHLSEPVKFAYLPCKWLLRQRWFLTEKERFGCEKTRAHLAEFV